LGWVSDEMFQLEALPERVVIVGAGFIACEFACILNGLGVQVTQLVRGEQILRGFDKEAALVVQEAMQAEGIDLRCQVSPTSITGSPGALTVHTQTVNTQTRDGETDKLSCAGVLLATGRRPFLEGLNLEAAGVAVESSPPRLWCRPPKCGQNCCGTHPRAWRPASPCMRACGSSINPNGTPTG
jgi:glutathione reductase (NADPH)